MFLNMEKFKKIGFFDENFFLYFEEFDLCKSLRNKGEKVYSSKKLKIHHLGFKSSFDENSSFKESINRMREWHWMWSSFYFYRKHFSYPYALNKMIGKLVTAAIKTIFYSHMCSSCRLKMSKLLIGCRAGAGILVLAGLIT